jgi:hypothetical protein
MPVPNIEEIVRCFVKIPHAWRKGIVINPFSITTWKDVLGLKEYSHQVLTESFNVLGSPTRELLHARLHAPIGFEDRHHHHVGNPGYQPITPNQLTEYLATLRLENGQALYNGPQITELVGEHKQNLEIFKARTESLKSIVIGEFFSSFIIQLVISFSLSYMELLKVNKKSKKHGEKIALTLYILQGLLILYSYLPKLYNVITTSNPESDSFATGRFENLIIYALIHNVMPTLQHFGGKFLNDQPVLAANFTTQLLFSKALLYLYLMVMSSLSLYVLLTGEYWQEQLLPLLVGMGARTVAAKIGSSAATQIFRDIKPDSKHD